MPSPMTPAEIAAASDRLRTASPYEVLSWAVDRFHPRLLMATAFGAEGCCIIHLLADINPAVRVINIDTGYQFPETLELRERIKDRYNIAVEFVRPELTVAEYEAEHGGPLHGHRPDQCCHDRKVLPLRAAMAHYAPLAWVSAIRKDQTADRGRADVVEWDPKFGVVKVNPLLGWTKKDVWGLRRQARRAVQPAPRPELPEHRLLALHPGGATGGGRPGRPVGREGQEGVRAARDRGAGRGRDLSFEFRV